LRLNLFKDGLGGTGGFTFCGPSCLFFFVNKLLDKFCFSSCNAGGAGGTWCVFPTISPYNGSL